ncbi:MAG: cytochrome c oxidase subunit II [Pirellulales bacterium]
MLKHSVATSKEQTVIPSPANRIGGASHCRRHLASLAVAFMLCCGLAQQAQASWPEMFNPAGPAAESIRDLFILVIAVCFVIFVAVGGSLAYFVFRFRDRKDSGNTEPPQIYGSKPIEVAWTLAPALTVLVLALVVIRSVFDLRGQEPTASDQRIRVVGHQWWWEFEYPEHGVITANEMVIPVSDEQAGRKIFLQLESADVIHSFWMPKLNGKTDLVPGKTNHMWIEANVAAPYFGRCAEYCGTQHANMLLRVDAVTKAEFDAWIAAQKEPAKEVASGDAGRERFMELACANCHTIRGTRANGKFGPDLTHLMSRKTIAAGMVENNRENLIRWVADPDDIKSGCRMPDMRLSEGDVKQIVDYLVTLE